jgi:hypothetical protein
MSPISSGLFSARSTSGCLFDRSFEFRNGLVVIIKRILPPSESASSLRRTAIGARFHSSQGGDHRMLIDTHV